MNESQEMESYPETQEELEEVKQSVVATWLNKSEPLARIFSLPFRAP